MTRRAFALLALVATLVAVATLPAGAANPGAVDATDVALVPTPMPPITGPMPQRRTIEANTSREAMPADLAAFLAQHATVTHVFGGATSVTPPSAELAALLEAEFASLK